MNWLWIQIAALMIASLSQAQAADHRLTLRESIAAALEKSPSYDSVRRTEMIQQRIYKSSFAKLLPSLDFSTTDGLQNNVPITNVPGNSTVNPTAPWSSSLSLGLTETLYDNGVSLTNLGVAEINSKIAQENLKKARDGLVLSVAQEFYRYSLANVLLEVRKQQHAMVEKQFKVLTSQYQQGFKEKIDYLRFKTQLQRAEIDQISAENSIALSQVQLRNLLGGGDDQSKNTGFVPIAVERQRRMEELEGRDQPALESFYDYRVSRLQEEVNAKTTTLTRRKYWPQLSLTSGMTYSNLNYLNSDQPYSATHQLSWNALLSLQYNIWDWGTRARDVEVAEANEIIQENGIHQTLIDLSSKISNLMVERRKISRNYQLTKDLLSLEEESYSQLDERYRDGKVTYLDLITGLNSLLDARVQFSTAYFDALQNILTYDYYNGKIYEKFAQ